MVVVLGKSEETRSSVNFSASLELVDLPDRGMWTSKYEKGLLLLLEFCEDEMSPFLKRPAPTLKGRPCPPSTTQTLERRVRVSKLRTYILTWLHYASSWFEECILLLLLLLFLFLRRARRSPRACLTDDTRRRSTICCSPAMTKMMKRAQLSTAICSLESRRKRFQSERETCMHPPRQAAAFTRTREIEAGEKKMCWTSLILATATLPLSFFGACVEKWIRCSGVPCSAE